MIKAVYEQDPNFPATDNHPDAVRYVINGLYVDAIGEPTAADVSALLASAIPPVVWTPLEFLERFTKDERITIRTAASQSADLADWLDLLRTSSQVLPTDPRTVDGMAALVTAGLITEARKVEILGG
tara:strand:- start:1228 stop:1608 length:381 start_codon:yes stop_codon:yes gene_type:complete